MRSFRLIVLAACLLAPRVMWALPTMIRLGYINCASCHISPQGGGLLNPYGRGIDEAQSLWGGEYTPLETGWMRLLNGDGRITQDFRSILQQQDMSTTGKAGMQIFRSRFLYRNATELGKGFRFTAVVTGENTGVLRPALAYESPNNAAQVFVNTALLSYRPADTLEFAVGRDQLPTGINVPDLSLFVKSRNRLGYYDAPTQVKAYWWGKRHLVSPYIYGPGGNEKAGFHEKGGGVLAEVDVLGKQRTVVGANVLRGSSALEDRILAGPYARLGFGKWGILAEQDFTLRTSKLTSTPVTFLQTASYGQLFWAAREWLVPSLIVERLCIDRPYEDRLDAIRFDLAARLRTQLTISAGPRIQRDELTGRISKGVVFQIAVKAAR